jgi:hypothetical protein
MSMTLPQTWRRLGYTLVSAMAGCCCGCGSQPFETAKVTGSVTLDGNPVTEGSVLFTPAQGWPARGELDAQGRFTLSTYEDQDGAIVGQHEIAIIAQSGPDPSEHFERPPPAPTKWLIPERYGSRATSGLRYEVKMGEPNEVALELYSNPNR